MPAKYCLALDLVNEPELIAQYDAYHKNIWPGIRQSIIDSGIINLEIYRFGNRLFMIMETTGDFEFSRKAAMDEANGEVQQWEQLMWKYQRSVPGAKPGEKWVLMDKIFSLHQ